MFTNKETAGNGSLVLGISGNEEISTLKPLLDLFESMLFRFFTSVPVVDSSFYTSIPLSIGPPYMSPANVV